MIPVAHENEVAYIYFSNEAFPSTYKHKIDKLQCKKNFIKFAYSDKLCECLTNIFPQNKIANLISFYNRMQAQNRIAKRKKKKKSR